MKRLSSINDKVLAYMSKQLSQINNSFNRLPIGSRKWIALGIGIVTVAFAVLVTIEPFINPSPFELQSGDITLPNDIYKQNNMKHQQTESLIPLGKMKGEIDGNFEAFYLAMNKMGELFINREPSYSQDRYVKSNGWEQITNDQFRKFEKQLHFIPHGVKSLRP